MASNFTKNFADCKKDLSKVESLIIGVVAGEVSGDALGASFMQQMNTLRDDIVWVGVGGAKMKAQGLQSLFEFERLALMGLVEVIAHLPDLLQARKELLTAFSEVNIDWFVGIDAPDFNIRVAKQLKPKGVFCVQYVSPSLWAWRESRIKSIKQATHLVLCLFPFELDVYERHHHPAVCVGHPLLQSTPKALATKPVEVQRQDLAWENNTLHQFFNIERREISQLICMMPGSRLGEINTILPLMLQAIYSLLEVDNSLCFIIPTVNQDHKHLIQNLIEKEYYTLKDIILVVYDDEQSNSHFSQTIMAISDIVVLASGTATLEAMLVNRPMVVVYKMNKLTYALISRLLKIPYVSLPNILAGKPIVAELIQEAATSDNIASAVIHLMQPRVYSKQQTALEHTTAQLHQQSTQSPALAIVEAWINHSQHSL